MNLRREAMVCWAGKGFSALWGWKSRALGGRPAIDKEVRDLIRRMSFENPLSGAPHIHGELLKLGFDVAQSTVSKYMVPRRDRPRQHLRPSFTNTLTGSRRLISLSVRRLPLSNSSPFLFFATGGRKCRGFRVTRIRP